MKTIFASVCLLLALAACSDKPTPAPQPVSNFATGLIKPDKREYGVMHWRAKRFQAPLPAEYDVEADGGKTPVRNQGNCGSCWAFGGTQTFEIGMQKFGGKTIDFSEQDLVGKYYSGCGGGYFVGEYQVKSGQAEEKDCPYSASNRRCTAKPVAQAVNWGMVGQPNREPTDEELQTAILAYGSVAVTVGANNSFMNLKSGFNTACPSAGTNHIVALVGWKTNPADGKIYFRIKNSWGTNWGDGGYAYVKRGCWNLAEEASWLAVAQVPCQPPKAHLPKESVLAYGDDVRLAVKPETGVTYSWYRADMKLADGPFLDMVARETMTVTLKASNRCGEAEVISLVSVAQ